MATKKVNIDIIAKDKTRMAMQGATRGINNLKNSVFTGRFSTGIATLFDN